MFLCGGPRTKTTWTTFQGSKGSKIHPLNLILSLDFELLSLFLTQCPLSKIDLRYFYGSFKIDPRRIFCKKLHLERWGQRGPFPLSLDLVLDEKRVDPSSFVVTA